MRMYYHEGVVLEFLKRLQGDNGVTEISDLKSNLGGLDKYNDIIKSNKDLYFISFVPNEKWEKDKEVLGKLPRTKNSHIKAINYVRADFDIRRTIFEKEGRVISEGELLTYKDKILERFDEDDLIGTYNAVVHSGNGIHIYWIGKSTEFTNPDDYSFPVQSFYDWIKECFPEEPHLRPDYSCRNIGRMLRLPGSWNYKAIYGLPPHEVMLLDYKKKDSPLINRVENNPYPYNNLDIGQEVFQNTDRLDNLKGYIKRLGLIKNGDNLYDKINTEIKISDLVCEYTGRKLTHDGYNFISNRDGCHTGAYVIPEQNIVVHEGTPHFSDYYKVYSPFAFLMVHYANGDPKKTFEIAKQKFPWLEEKGSKFNFNKKFIKNGNKKS